MHRLDKETSGVTFVKNQAYGLEKTISRQKKLITLLYGIEEGF